MDGEQLVALLVENGVGVERKSHDLIELEDEDASVNAGRELSISN